MEMVCTFYIVKAAKMAPSENSKMLNYTLKIEICSNSWQIYNNIQTTGFIQQ